MAYELIKVSSALSRKSIHLNISKKVLRQENIEYVVAPYEADAQLAYLEKVGHVSAIITEDSDLLVFGCKRVMFYLGFFIPI